MHKYSFGKICPNSYRALVLAPEHPRQYKKRNKSVASVEKNIHVLGNDSVNVKLIITKERECSMIPSVTCPEFFNTAALLVEAWCLVLEGMFFASHCHYRWQYHRQCRKENDPIRTKKITVAWNNGIIFCLYIRHDIFCVSLTWI